jgi:YidC/Oxa1 family membrane protein insertase
MAKMQKLQPEIAKLREKYKDDKAKLNEEMMKFYRTQGTGGFLLGCLPMALQMPIWVALWSGLNASVELRQAGFLPWWITDLAAPDAIMSWAEPIYLPLVSGMAGPINSLNLLPLLLTVAMVLQQKLMPSTPQTANPNDPAAKQQKMMMWMMPVFMLLLFYNAPSGLTLYIMASTFAGVVESYVIRKHIRERDAQQASVETRVDMPGKGFRGERPKKPKGPFGR